MTDSQGGVQVAGAIEVSVRPAWDNRPMDAGTAIAILVILGVLLLGLGAFAAVVLVALLRLQSQMRGVSKGLPGPSEFALLSERLRDVEESSRSSYVEISRTLGGLEQATHQMMEVGKTVSGLEDLLRPPKLRGGMGETLLAELLAQILPASTYELQHRFSSGERVDAAISLGDAMVPVDAKFPLESFRRLSSMRDESEAAKERKAFLKVVKAHIEHIAQKYILPDEGTYDFALMYIPAENVYYETILKAEGHENLFPFALDKRVIPVSPNSFYAYLQVIIHGLKGLQIEERAREIMGHLGRLQGEEDRFRTEFDTLGLHLENARKKYEDAQRRLVRFEDKLLSTAGEGEPTSSPREGEKSDSLGPGP